MTQDNSKATMHSVALIAMYLMAGYNAAARELPPSQLQELSGHLAVADEVARIAAAIHEVLETEALAVGGEAPGVLEYEVIEPMGAWIHAHSMCTIQQASDEFSRRYLAWMGQVPEEGNLNVLELARKAVEARGAYVAALRALEQATAGREGGWPRQRRQRVEEYIDVIGVVADSHPNSPLQTLLAVAGGTA